MIILILELVAIFLVMYNGYKVMLVDHGIIWGIAIKQSSKQKVESTHCKLLLIIGIILFIILSIPALAQFFSLLIKSFILGMLYAVVWILAFAISAVLAKSHTMKSLDSEQETNALILGELPIMKKIESEMDEAVSFVVSFEGVALVNKMNYCYAVERYEDYKMGSLTTPNEVALVGLYFVQKYNDKFNFKVDMETIPGTPGQMVTAFGTGGFNVAYVEGTPDKRIFRSYIFTRK